MISHTAQISNPIVAVKPSSSLRKYLSEVKESENIPVNIKRFIQNYHVKDALVHSNKPEVPVLMNNNVKELIESVNLVPKPDYSSKLPTESKIVGDNGRLLTLSDLHWLCRYIQHANDASAKKIYLHELLEGSDIILPKNDEVPRNEELELKCRKLKVQQENREYEKMTKNVDSIKKHYPDDTRSYQMEQINRSLMAIFQFIVSVAAGFVFGFIGVELIIGTLDFRFRLLLGIICALVVALAELYFLAKTLNEELQLETNMQGTKNSNFE